MPKFKDIEEQAKKELAEEEIRNKKELLKERIREIEEAEKTMRKLKRQYQDLLEKDIDEIDDIDEEF